MTDILQIVEALGLPTGASGNGTNLARQIVRRAELGDQVPAFTIHKACASGLQAIVSGAQSVRLGDSSVVLAGGVEHMTSVPFLALDVRWGKKLGDETRRGVGAAAGGTADDDGQSLARKRDGLLRACMNTR
mgnify:CR=1 FL=1